MLIISLLFCTLNVWAGSDKHFINNIFNNPQEQVNCFVVDSYGQIWFGTSRGLYSYDGYTSRRCLYADCQVYTAFVRRDTIFLGTEDGISLYSIAHGTCSTIPCSAKAVRAFVAIGDSLLVGAGNGIYVLDFERFGVRKLNDDANATLPNETIYSLAQYSENQFFIGTYDGLYLYDIANNTVENIELPKGSRMNNFVNSLLVDNKRRKLLVGTEGFLYTYSFDNKQFTQERVAQGNSIKYLAFNGDDNLLICTDNGLFISELDGDESHFVHSSTDESSLIGNNVWTIYVDAVGNEWVGTDCGISLCVVRSNFVGLSALTGESIGNTITTMLVDSRGRKWLGGTNGLIMLERSGASRWFRLGSVDNRLSHNRIRSIYEDRDGAIWLATDGGVNRYDEKNEVFVNYNVVDNQRVHNANWAYDMFDDGDGHLWIATCQGGVLIAEKQQFTSTKTDVVAIRSMSQNDGSLPSDYIEQFAVADKYVYMLLHRFGVWCYDKENKRLTQLSAGKSATKILSTTRGQLFVACDDAIHIYADTTEIHVLNLAPHTEIFDMCEADDKIWLSAVDGLWCVDNEDVKRYVVSQRRYTSLCYSAADSLLYLGANDGISMISPSNILNAVDDRKTFVSALYINDLVYAERPDLRFVDEIELSSKENNLIFELADYDYSSSKSFAYMLQGHDNEWHTLSIGENRVQYQNLHFGTYVMKVGKMLPDMTYVADREMVIRILPPFYQTIWAYVIYVLIFFLLLRLIYTFYNVRNRLRIEQIERRKTLEQTQMKIDFFTNVSHEFKTPMSLIIGPLDRMVKRADSSSMRRELQSVLSSALSLNKMITRALNFARVDSDIANEYNFSYVEIVEFAESILNIHKETADGERLTLSFQSDVDEAFVYVDAVKMESVLNNLIGNACKYTSEGAVNVCISVDNKYVSINITDTGIGIAEDDLSKIFQRYYCPARATKGSESTGIGLFLVKQFVEKFGGTVEAQSDGKSGSTFVVKLPIAKAPQRNHDRPTDVSPSATVLIVDDNRQIADFVENELSNSYTCYTAHNGKAGLDLALKYLPDVIIADIMMPVMDGIEMTRHIRANKQTTDIPIIMLTAKDDAPTEKISLGLKVNAFVAKPFDIEQLVLRIEQLLSSRKAIEKRAHIDTILEPKKLAEVSDDERFVMAVQDCIEENLADADFNVNALAVKMKMSPKQLYRRMKAITNRTPIEYLNEVRMKKAAMLLAQGSFTVSEVMYLVGYSNNSYFAKCFSAVYGMSPKQFASAKTE